MFNIENLDTESKQEAGAWLHLRDPATGELAYANADPEKPCRIKFKGYQSDAGKQSVVNGRNKMMKAAIKQGKKDTPKEMTLEDLNENALSDAETLTALVLDWENIPGADGEMIPFSKDAFYNAASRMLDLRKQALEHIQDQTVFFEA